MEPLWSPVVAIAGNQWQIGSESKPQEQAETVALGCDRLPMEVHGKEGVDGSSPSEGFTKTLQSGAFHLKLYLHGFQRDRVWNTFWNTRSFDQAPKPGSTTDVYYE
jgi:hypothetical protein